MDLIQKAREFAIKAHGDQKYGKMPYKYHLQQVVSKLILWRDFNAFTVTDENIAVAWLHDVIEDTLATEDSLIPWFGKEVAFQVLLLSKTDDLSYGDYITIIKDNPVARLVKIADTMCNLEASLMGGEIKRINKYAKQLALLTEKLDDRTNT